MLARLEQVVVLRGGEVARALDVAAGELAGRRLVERPLAAGEHPRVVDQVLDHRLGFRPVHLCRATKRMNASVGGGSARSPGDRGRGADQDEREDAIGEVEREQLREPPAGRDADHVRRRDS